MPVCRRSSLFLRKANTPSPLVLQKYLVIQKKKHRKKEKKSIYSCSYKEHIEFGYPWLFIEIIICFRVQVKLYLQSEWDTDRDLNTEVTFLFLE